jgi:hypothetical protein
MQPRKPGITMQSLNQQVALEHRAHHNKTLIAGLAPAHDLVENFAIPNEFLRCALFGIKQSNKGLAPLTQFEYRLQAPLQSKITYTGPVLTQAHLQVLGTLIGRCQNGNDLTVSTSALAMEAGLGDTPAAKQNLEAILSDLFNADLTIESKDRIRLKQNVWLDGAIKLRLVSKLVPVLIERGSKQVKGFILELPADIAKLFGGNKYTLLSREVLSKLRLNDGLARWLANFYSSHKDPQPISLSQIHQLTGSDASIKEFKRLVSKALQQLVDVEFLLSFQVTGGFLIVERNNKAALFNDWRTTMKSDELAAAYEKENRFDFLND